MIRTPGFRRMVDSRGVAWEIWEVHPRLVERRGIRDRRAVPRPEGGIRRAAGPDHRPWEPGMGWLVFRSEHGERRRRAIESGWERLPAEGLRELLQTSRTTGAFPRVPRA